MLGCGMWDGNVTWDMGYGIWDTCAHLIAKDLETMKVIRLFTFEAWPRWREPALGISGVRQQIVYLT